MSRAFVFLLLLMAVQMQAAAQDPAVYTVDSENSRADILVFRAGALARFGHDHVISTMSIQGSVTIPLNFTDSTAELAVKPDTLEVDREELRNKYGFDTKLSKSAKMGTRKNMLDKVLETADWPQVSILATVIETGPEKIVLDVSITLHGVARKFELPVSLQIDADQLHVQGAFGLRQTDYAIEPFSIMGGAMRVRDGVEIHFDLVANRGRLDTHSDPEETNR